MMMGLADHFAKGGLNLAKWSGILRIIRFFFVRFDADLELNTRYAQRMFPLAVYLCPAGTQMRSLAFRANRRVWFAAIEYGDSANHPNGSRPMSSLIGQPLEALDTPQLLLNLDVIDANLRRMFNAGKERGVNVRTHFKSLKCGGLARYIQARGGATFLCAKLNEAEVLADSGITDILLANQIVNPRKMERLANLARRVQLAVCVDRADNVDQLSQAMNGAGATLGVLVEVDVGMARCGVPPGEAAVALAQRIHTRPGLRFNGLQGYDGHLQLLPDVNERRAKSLQALDQLVGTRRLIEQAGIPVRCVTGAGTGTWEFVAGYDGVTEIQPGSFVLMDCIYHTVRAEFGCALSILAMVLSVHPQWYILDAGSKAISRDFGTPVIKGRPEEKVDKLSEEHTKVLCESMPARVGDLREVLPAHCCATMNLHRQCLGVRQGKVETVWPIEASGRYD
jgi:D-serine deaminase-like pyridoxal phosphate-dependent protein